MYGQHGPQEDQDGEKKRDERCAHHVVEDNDEVAE